MELSLDICSLVANCQEVLRYSEEDMVGILLVLALDIIPIGREGQLSSLLVPASSDA